MDSTKIIIMSIVILLIFILPFVAMSWIRTKRKRSLLTSLNAVAEKNNCKITHYDSWNDRAIGLDNAAHKLFFLQRVQNLVTKKEIMLSEVQKCRVVKTNRTMRANRENYNMIHKLELIFEFTDKKQADEALEFYNTDTDRLTPADELHLIEKWKESSMSAIALSRFSQKE